MLCGTHLSKHRSSGTDKLCFTKHFQFRGKYPRGFPQKNKYNSAPVVFRTFEDRVITQKMVNRIQLQQGQRDVQELKNNCLFSG